ncbi:MAG: AarF/UbiB family protein [Verrucomicrobiota bacterium]
MKLSLKPHHLKRYKDIALLFWKYGNTDLAKEFANEAAGGEKTLLAAKPGQPAPEELADDLEKMGPTFIKFGQLLSSRADLLPKWNKLSRANSASACQKRSRFLMNNSGTKITALSPIAQLDMNGDVLAEELFKAYLKQVLIDGFFHADPHPGNIFLTNDGRVALLDLGMTGRLSSNMQEHLLRLLVAISEGNGDEAVKIIRGIMTTRMRQAVTPGHSRFLATPALP